MDAQSTDVNQQVADTTIADSSTDENEDQDVELVLEDESTPSDDKGNEAEQETESQQDDAGDEDQQESGENETEGKPTKAEARKEQLNQEIRDLVATRNAIKQQVQQDNQGVYQPPSVDQLLDQVNPDTGEYYNRLEAQLESMKQNQALRDYNDQVAESRLVITNEAQKAIRDFPIFDEESSDYNPTIAAQVDEIVGRALVRDQNTGQVIGSHIPLYQLYKTVYETNQLAATQGQVKAQKAQSAMLANSDSTQSAASEKKIVDPIMKVLMSDLD